MSQHKAACTKQLTTYTGSNAGLTRIQHHKSAEISTVK